MFYDAADSIYRNRKSEWGIKDEHVRFTSFHYILSLNYRKENSQKLIKIGSTYCEILMEFMSLRRNTSHSATR
jgi:hypothetical protein